MSNETPKELVERLAAMPLSFENMHSTWCPPEWEDIVDWWDGFVSQARDAVKDYSDE